MPTTGLISYDSSIWGAIFTIEFPEIIIHTLKHCPSTPRSGNETSIESLALIIPDNIHNRQDDNRRDDSEGSIPPPPTAGRNERLRCGWPNERSDDVGRAGDGGDEGSVLETGGVGYEDVDDVGYAVETYPVEDL